MNNLKKHYIILLSCPDKAGIVAKLTTKLCQIGADIRQSHQFSEPTNNRFFMRLSFTIGGDFTKPRLTKELSPLFEELHIEALIHDSDDTPRMIILVSKQDHALMDLLYQTKVGWLKAHVTAIVSNHEVAKDAAQQAGIPFYYWPVDKKEGHVTQEAKLRELIKTTQSNLLVLARYMQIFSDKFCRDYQGKMINIHHSFLPSFKGARPYQQAWERGVKLIGATAHYVTPDLDEGPIIEQDTTRVTHSLTVEDFVAKGRNIECRVLTQAVKLHTEYRIMLNGKRTVIFS